MKLDGLKIFHVEECLIVVLFVLHSFCFRQIKTSKNSISVDRLNFDIFFIVGSFCEGIARKDLVDDPDTIYIHPHVPESIDFLNRTNG